MKLSHSALLLLLFYTGTSLAEDQELPEYVFPPVTVFESSLSELISQYLLTGQTLHQKDIKELPVQNIADAFRFTPGIQTHTRGSGNVQVDLSLRGSSSEQVSIFVDGMPMNDPQTGHHHADIPVLPHEIERIEVLTGPAAAVLGSSNIGGVIHIHTRKAYKKETHFSVEQGKFNTTHIQLGQSLKTGAIHHKFNFQTGKSNGYRYDTEYNTQTYTYSNYLSLGDHEFRGNIGYSKKDFGANDFYADYPSFEKTKSLTGSLSANFTVTNILQLRTTVYQRWHDDDFTLDFECPELYQATHETVTRGVNLYSFYQVSQKTTIALGSELREEKIESQPLGNHVNHIYSFSNEFVHYFSKKWMLHTGLKSVFTNHHGNMVNPSLQLGWHLNWISVKLSTGRVFRAPSFTEKYYASPANIGDRNLKAETGWIHDLGTAFNLGNIKIEPTLFIRHEKNRIEWIRAQAHNAWRSVNFNPSSVTGYEIHLNSTHSSFNFKSSIIGLFNESLDYHDLQTKYPFNTLRLQVFSSLSWNLPFNIQQSLFARYNDYKGFKTYSVIDTRISKKIKHWLVFLSLTNVFNTQYEEIKGLPMPGFGWNGGFKYELSN